MIDLKKLAEYKEVKSELGRVKANEMRLRLEILEDMFPNASAGTMNETLGQYKVKGTFRNTTTIDADAYFDYEDQMTDAERCCVKLKPSIILANYKDLENHETSGLLDDIITIKPATPALTLEIEE